MHVEMTDPTKNRKGVLNVRGLDAEMVQRAKNISHTAGKTLREFVAEALRREIERREGGK